MQVFTPKLPKKNKEDRRARNQRRVKSKALKGTIPSGIVVVSPK